MICGFGDKDCALCAAGDGCVCGRDEDEFVPATREVLLERWKSGAYPSSRDILAKALGINDHIADDSKKVKPYCETCFWWNQTCHNAKSCCYGDEREANNFCGWWEYKNQETNTEPYDSVNHPEHYTQGGIECIDCIKAALGENFIGFLVGNVIKYAYRYKDKNGVEDLKKAAVYLNWAIKELDDDDE